MRAAADPTCIALPKELGIQLLPQHLFAAPVMNPHTNPHTPPVASPAHRHKRAAP